MQEFIQEYFAKPILEYEGYNLVNTLAYAVILLFVAFVIVYPLFNKRGVKFDKKFVLALIPYICFGSTIRILEDLKILARSANPLELGFYFVSPGIYILVGVLTIISLLVSLIVSKKINRPFYQVFGFVGLCLTIPPIIFDLTQIQTWFGFFSVIVLFAVAVLLAKILVEKLWQKDFFQRDPLNLYALSAQTLDGVATFVALGIFSCGEQHVLSKAIIDWFSPLAFPIVKIALILVILHYLDKEIKDPNLRGFIKVFVIILGLAPGIRDLFMVGIGICL